MPTIFQDSYLDRLLQDAERDAVNKVDYLFYRESMSVEQGISTYRIPFYIRKIMRVSWKGAKVHPITWQEMAELAPSSFIGQGPGDDTLYEYSQGVPKYYCLHPNNINDIRFFPTPNETIGVDDSGVMGSTIGTTVILTYFRAPDVDDTFFQMPPYIQRRTAKAYAACKAFSREGKGQNLVAAKYYADKLTFLYDYFAKINSGAYCSKRPRLNSNLGNGGRIARPSLPSNFEVRDPLEN
jgi:hypothetical protein